MEGSTKHELDWLDEIEPLSFDEEECDCDVFVSSKSRLNQERENVLNISINKCMNERVSKFDKPILRRRTLIKNTMDKVHEEIKREEAENVLKFLNENEIKFPWEFEDYQDNFEFSNDLMDTDCCIYEDNNMDVTENLSQRKRGFDEVNVEDDIMDCLSESVDELSMVNFESLPKSFKADEGDY